MRVLIVDDREEDRYLLETLLQASGYEVVSADNGVVALEKLGTQSFELVISDILMPVMDGFRLCIAVHEDPALRHIPFVFYTATYTDEQDEKLALGLGANKFVRKPQEPDEFIRIMRDVISRPLEGQLPAIKKSVIENKDDVFELYSQRLVKKLETKMLALEQELARRTQAEEALQESEAYFRSVLEHAQDLVTIVDRDGAVGYQSPSSERVLGYPPEELIGRNVLDLVHPEDQTDVAEKIAEAFAEPGATYAASFRFRHRDGGWRTLESTGSTHVPSDAPPRAVINSRDVTKQMEVWRQMCEAQRMEAVGKLASGVAHDFNNILTIILSTCGFLMRELSGNEKALDDVSQIRDAGERAAALTAQLLAFGRHQIIKRQVVDLNALVADLGKMLHRLIGEDIDLSVTLAPDLASTWADPGQIDQVVMNLVINARDAMPTGGELTIKSANVAFEDVTARLPQDAQPGPYVLLTVRDTGHGMDEQTRVRIFDPFFTTKPTGQGTGLGLSTVHDIVAQSDGHIFVDSKPGVGTTFSVYLPASLDDDRTLSGTEPMAVVSTPTGSETILVVEDESTLRRLIQRILVQRGYAVLVASGGPEATRIAESYADPIHLLLTDVVMPGMDGRAVAESLRALRPDAKVLFISGYTDDAVLLRGVAAEEVDFLRKPFTPDVLARKVRDVLDRIGDGDGDGQV